MTEPLSFTIRTERDDAAAFLVAYLRRQARLPSLIRIEGDPLAGKSTLARALSEQLGWRVVRVDDHLDGAGIRQRTFPEAVQQEALAEAVGALSSGPFIIEGTWLEASAPPARFGNGFRVYVAFDPPSFIADAVRRIRSKFQMER